MLASRKLLTYLNLALNPTLCQLKGLPAQEALNCMATREQNVFDFRGTLAAEVGTALLASVSARRVYLHTLLSARHGSMENFGVTEELTRMSAIEI